MPVVSVAAPASRGGPGQGRGGATLRSPQRRLAPRGGRSALLRRRPAFQRGIGLARRVIRSRRALADRPQRLAHRARAHRRGTVRPRRPCRDRKSVVSGKSVSVRVDLGGRRIIKKQKNKKTRKTMSNEKHSR